MRPTLPFFAVAVSLLAASCAGSTSQAAPRSGQAVERGATRAPNAYDAYARDTLKELIEINTTESSGDTTKAAQAMATRLRSAGFPEADLKVLGEEPRHGNLVARLRGSGKKRPLLLLAHLDVVEAKKEDWSFDPFVFREQDGYFYGRGTSDDKDMAANFVTILVGMMKMKKEGIVPNRDIILALTSGEESGPYDGVRWLLEKHRDLIDAELAINEGGSGQIKKGKYIANELQTSEKLFTSWEIEAKNKGGHSSLPSRDNAIYRLSEALTRISKFVFPVELNDTTRAYFERLAVIEHNADMAAVAKSGDTAAAARLSEHPLYNATLRTTCVATMLQGGHAENALPQSARATINCRILPGTEQSRIEETLRRVIDDAQIEIRMIPHLPAAPASPLSPEVLKAVEGITNSMWPGVPTLPVMLTAATDGSHLRRAGIACYGVSGEFSDIDDTRAHGKDERVLARSFYEGREFLDRLVRKLATGP
ncbi:M20/M25/M40 family metallo-hydrolase [Pendulispora brunnea]|uniref:M20/M25/M40 family metallo-hydrolase n=1 Tax=Pendulispora brunnea TaxID=2905690 RepID=A0ABZ2KGN9_9BACT